MMCRLLSVARQGYYDWRASCDGPPAPHSRAGRREGLYRFRERALTHTTFPYVFLDATYCKVRVGAHVVSQALVVATGVSIDGTREVLGTMVGDSESFDFWREFLVGLRGRGLSGVHLVVSDAHAGLKAAVAQQFTGASW